MSESLVIYNTLTRKKDTFTPIVPNKVSMYLCGVTVYDNCHIGHARAYVVFDSIRRHLSYLGYDVTFVQNFTDIDDKIIKRAQEEDIPWKNLTKITIKSFFEDMDALNISRASHYPKATEHIGEMIAIIKDLIEKGIAYESGGDICFSVEACESYGKLSKKQLEDLIAGSRVDVNQLKKNPLDFVLWKQAKPEEPSWGSPWGKGRPGWHIECSAMAKKWLGETIDIHAGGEDLVFPHHENEIAQSECHTGKQLANYWLHNGFVKIKDEKMSKSLNNFFTIKDILKDVPGVALRYFLSKVHYRLPIHFSKEGLEEAQQSLKKIAELVEKSSEDALQFDEFSTQKEARSILADYPELLAFLDRFDRALSNDFNFSEAVAVLFDLSKYCHKSNQGFGLLQFLAQRLGLNLSELNQDIEVTPEMKALLDARIQARANKDFQASDRLRDELKQSFGIEVLDGKDGYTLKRI